MAAGQGINVGDAVMTFVADSQQTGYGGRSSEFRGLPRPECEPISYFDHALGRRKSACL
jgi:hypothetical protein